MKKFPEMLYTNESINDFCMAASHSTPEGVGFPGGVSVTCFGL